MPGCVYARLDENASRTYDVWRDAICNWFLRTSEIPDAQGSVGHHPGRFEAAYMQLTGYTLINVIPWENASAGKAIPVRFIAILQRRSDPISRHAATKSPLHTSTSTST